MVIKQESMSSTTRLRSPGSRCQLKKEGSNCAAKVGGVIIWLPPKITDLEGSPKQETEHFCFSMQLLYWLTLVLKKEVKVFLVA